MDQRGGKRTFEHIYNTYRDGMFRYAQTLTNGDQDISEDILQYAFMDIARNIHRLTELNDMQTKVYLLRAVRTWAQKLMRKEREIRELEKRWEEKYAPTLVQHEEDLLDQLCTCERMDTIRSILKSMPDEYREILMSYYLLEESLGDIAQRMKLPYSTVQKRCQRGTKLVVAKLKRKVKKGEL